MAEATRTTARGGASAATRSTASRSGRPGRGGSSRSAAERSGPLSADALALIDAYWRAANYLSVGQIYLLDNPLLREPLRAGPRQAAPAGPLGHDARAQLHLRPHEPGHPGLGPGRHLHHGSRARRSRRPSPTPTWRAPTRRSTRASRGTPRACASSSASSPSRAASPATSRPETPGSIHEGGELGYALAHAYGAAFDNPDLVVCCVVGDGEAETGPLATSWHSNKFLDPVRDGAVLPILHLNGYKIANPTVLARIPEDELVALFVGYGYQPLRRGRRRPATRAPGHGGHDGHRHRGDRGHPARRPRGPLHGAPALADDRAAHAQGLDGPEERRWPAVGGHLPLPPGAHGRGAHQPRAPRPARDLAAQLPARGALRRRRRARPGAGGAAAAELPAHERQPARQRRPAPARPVPAGLPRLRRGGARGRAAARRRPPASWARSCAT